MLPKISKPSQIISTHKDNIYHPKKPPNRKTSPLCKSEKREESLLFIDVGSAFSSMKPRFGPNLGIVQV